MAAPNDNSSNVGSDVEITGTLTFKGAMIFDGKLRDGNIAGTILTIGSNGEVKGNVETDALTLHGKITGDVLVTGRCELKGSATLIGSLTTNRLVMDDGATLIGRAEITPDTTGEAIPAYEGAEFPPGLASLKKLKL